MSKCPLVFSTWVSVSPLTSADPSFLVSSSACVHQVQLTPWSTKLPKNLKAILYFSSFLSQGSLPLFSIHIPQPRSSQPSLGLLQPPTCRPCHPPVLQPDSSLYNTKRIVTPLLRDIFWLPGSTGQTWLPTIMIWLQFTSTSLSSCP